MKMRITECKRRVYHNLSVRYPIEYKEAYNTNMKMNRNIILHIRRAAVDEIIKNENTRR